MKMTTKKIAGTAVMAALTIVLTLISNYIAIGTVSINLAIIPIALTAIMYGPLCALIVGLINGGLVLLAPSTQAFFFSLNPVATVFICLLKTGLAGLIAGFVYKAFKKHELVGMIVASLIVPIVNTGLFTVGAFAFFLNLYGDFKGLMISVLSINFVIEFVITAALSPATVKVVNITKSAESR